MDTIDRREWLYTQSDDAVVAEICLLEGLVREMGNLISELTLRLSQEHINSIIEILNRDEVKKIMGAK